MAGKSINPMVLFDVSWEDHRTKWVHIHYHGVDYQEPNSLLSTTFFRKQTAAFGQIDSLGRKFKEWMASDVCFSSSSTRQ